MLDGLLGKGFAGKCKSLIKLTKSRIDVIRRKRKATEKFLKKDIADLLLDGLDTNAYGRAEGLVVELTLSSCYGFVEKACELVLKHLSVMQKLSGCPEECRVAVSSLMFAAARFSDLPELRDLRKIFQERYGNSFECYVNQEFAANLNSNSSTLEKKVCLMEEIASEFSINWDSNAFKLTMSRSSSFAQGHNASMSDYDIPSLCKDHTQKGGKNDVLLERSPDHANGGYKFQNGKEEIILNKGDNNLQSKSIIPGNVFKSLNGFELLRKRDGHDNPLTGRQEVTAKKSDGANWKEGSMLKSTGRSSQEITVENLENGSKMHDSWRTTTPLRETLDSTTTRKSPSHKMHDSWRTTTPLRETMDSTTTRKSPSHSCFRSNVNEPFAVNHVGLPDTNKSERKVQTEKTPTLKPCYSNDIPSDIDKSESIVQKDKTPTPKPCYGNGIPPPYVKSNSKQQSGNCIPPPYVKSNSKQQSSTRGTDVVVSSHIDSGAISTYYSANEKPDATSVSERIHIGFDKSYQDGQASKHESLSKQGHEKEYSIREDAREVRLAKPKSMRKKHSRSRSKHYDAANEDTGIVRKSRSRSRRRDESRSGLQMLFDDERHQNAEEEKIIDKLLSHYSSKPSILVPEKVRKKPNSDHAHLMDTSTKKLVQNIISDGSDKPPEMVTLAPRSVSLPREQPRVVEIKKEFVRAASFQPDTSKDAQHVHPKLPDYDDLAARFAALRGR